MVSVCSNVVRGTGRYKGTKRVGLGPLVKRSTGSYRDSYIDYPGAIVFPPQHSYLPTTTCFPL